ncbi:TetR family transcriptional regulator [Streptomyces noursei]|uniref:TetR family transcriptional regulator n=2 Tax=Streptomyces TaxID=1883 RepID=UPI000B1575C0|nr:TetR family transcriptional regulator [Streptomyces noursei]
MSHSVGGVRQAQKQKTRQALLDAALGLLEEQSLSSLGLREVTRVVGVAPTAFYRHFRDLGELGVALVEEALGSLHVMVRAILAEQDAAEERIDRTIAVVERHVREHPAHVRFVARERRGGVRAVRHAIAGELDRFAAEVAAALKTQPVSAGWRDEDVRMLAELYVDRLVTTAAELLDAREEGGEEAVERVVWRARRQLRLISLGRRHWGEEGQASASVAEAEAEAESGLSGPSGPSGSAEPSGG